MLRYNNYVFAKNLEEAYELNQKRNNVVIGGNGWLKMSDRQLNTVIDLSELGLDKIIEDDEKFTIGAMVTLRDIEKNKALNNYSNGAVKESLKHIVGTQFRNNVTVGGSIYGRFGFSDVLTMFMVMDSYVELYKGGIVPLYEFSKMKYDNDILVNLIVKKKPLKMAYSSFRNQSTDFPVLTCAISVDREKITTAIGARPSKADITGDDKNILGEYIYKIYEGTDIDDDINNAVCEYSKVTSECFEYESNLRASGEYRKHIANILIKRTLKNIINNCHN